MVSRTVTAIITASMLTLQWTPELAYAENQMGYRLLSVQEASRLPRNHGAFGMDVERAQQITDDGMTFDLFESSRCGQARRALKQVFVGVTRLSPWTAGCFRALPYSLLMSDRFRPAAVPASITFPRAADPRRLSALP